jgi:hypothetical protein
MENDARLERLKAVCRFEDPVTYDPIVHPVLLDGRFYECDTALRLYEHGMRNPFTRGQIQFDDLHDAPSSIQDMCAALAADEGVTDAEGRLRRRYGKFLYIKGRFEAAADLGYLRAIVEMAEEEEVYQDKWFRRLLAADPLQGGSLRGFINLREESGDRAVAHDALVGLWSNPSWEHKKVTAYLIAVNYYHQPRKLRHAARWCKRAEELNCAKLLAAHICYRMDYYQAHQKWNAILSHLPTHTWIRAESATQLPVLMTAFTYMEHAHDAAFLLEYAKTKLLGVATEETKIPLMASRYNYVPAMQLVAGKKPSVRHRLAPYTTLFSWE